MMNGSQATLNLPALKAQYQPTELEAMDEILPGGAAAAAAAAAAKAEADEKRKRKIERARETEKMLREKFATWCSTKDLDMMVHRTLGHSMCLASGLGAHDEGCVTCAKAKQRRKGHSSVAVKPHDRSRHWGGDSCGIITPPSYQMHRYFHAVHDEGLGYEQNIPVRSKHSKLSAEALEDFAKEVKHYPVGWSDDGGKEYEGEVIEWFKQVGHKNGKPVAEFKSN